MNAPYLMFCGLAALTIAACGGTTPVAPEANETEAPDNSAVLPPDKGEKIAIATPNKRQGAIPEQLRGRWGMTPDDCTSTRGDAKGLMTVGAGELRFYESVAKPTGDVQTSGDTAAGRFDFTGEGQNWTRYQSLQIQDGKLIRTERDPGGSYTYVRCD